MSFCLQEARRMTLRPASQGCTLAPTSILWLRGTWRHILETKLHFPAPSDSSGTSRLVSAFFRHSLSSWCFCISTMALGYVVFCRCLYVICTRTSKFVGICMWYLLKKWVCRRLYVTCTGKGEFVGVCMWYLQKKVSL